MSMTFRVDDVEPAREPLPTRPYADVVGHALAFGGDPDRAVIEHGPTHPLLGAVHRAFADHRPLVLSPDAVWLTIARGVAQHVRLHAEALRPRLVRHAARKTLEVKWLGPAPTDADSWARIVEKFRDEIAGEVGAGRARLLECDFSTTTDVERVASRIVLMDVYSPYFDYYLVAVCGIPEVTLLGTADDWRSIRERVDVIAELDLAWWASSLVPIADELVRAASGQPDVAFWKRIFNPRDAYGGERITGWITRLYPYLESRGRVDVRNPMLELPIDEPRGWDRDDMFGGPGICSDQIPAGPSTARVDVDDLVRGLRFRVDLDGGVLAVAQDSAGRLMPVCGWVLRAARSAIDGVIDRIRAAHQAVPAPAQRSRREQAFLQGPADVMGLYAQLDGAILFAATAPWRILPMAEWESIEVIDPTGKWMTSAMRFLDLPDGTYIAFASRSSTLHFVRAPAGGIWRKPLTRRKGPYTADDIVTSPNGRTARQAAHDFQVVGTSLAEILDRALDSEGALDLPAQGTLLDLESR